MDERALRREGSLGLVQLGIAMMLFVFVPAGTVRYWQGWLFLAVFLGASLAISLFLWRTDRGLLERRLRAGPGAETRGTQKLVQAVMGLAFVATLVIPALVYRWHGASLPPAVCVLGDGLVALGYWIVFRVFRANSFAAATIEVGARQTVSTTGPYALVRHPMYSAALVLFLGMPLALGSAWGLWTSLVVGGGLVWRLLDEEALLVRDLEGYDAYRRQTRYRLIPYVW